LRVGPADVDLMEEEDEVAETDAPSAKKPRKSAAILEDSDDEDAAQPQGDPPQVLTHGNLPVFGLYIFIGCFDCIENVCMYQ
jgi:hypothetical protein